MKSFAEIDKETNGSYIQLLKAVAKLSGLFSESLTPFVNYRIAENIFCKSFNAINLSRSDTAFDAQYKSIGIGLKTFTIQKNNSLEKVAEFNSASKELSKYGGKDLAFMLGEKRNERMDSAFNRYNISDSLYHIVARLTNKILLFETDYKKIELNKIHSVKENRTSLSFEDGINYYSYNFSKSTLYRRFVVPTNVHHVPIDIIDDPFKVLLDVLQTQNIVKSIEKYNKGINYVVLPLYSLKNNTKYNPTRSGLNQWNASGRKRDISEIYIPIPIEIHKRYPNFFPKRDEHFNLTIPSGDTFKAKVCQDNSKALMTDPNKAMSDWLLRKVLLLKEGELVTIEKLNSLGFDSVIISKKDDIHYSIDVMKTDSYVEFLSDQ